MKPMPRFRQPPGTGRGRHGYGLAVRRLIARAVPCSVVMLAAAGSFVPAAATARRARTPVTTESALRRAWADPQRRRIDLGADIMLRDCRHLEPIRESPYPIVLDGHGHTLRQTCFEHRLLRQDGTGFLDLRRVHLTRGGADGPGAAVTTRGELRLTDGVVNQNLSEEPGGGLFSMRRVIVRRSHINGNLANDDGGGVYARRGGVRVYDSVLSNNLVDGSGGAVGSTGDILIVRSQVDGNTTDGDGGALYADEDGDVTVIRSLIDGSDADGPGGAIFTLDGDVAVFDSSLIGNRADDRGGAISGEADVLVVNSTVARNLAVAHAGGGVWARGNLALINSTVTDNYAEGEGGGILGAGTTTVLASTVSGNIGSIAANVGTAGLLRARASIIGPAKTDETTGDTRPTRRSCRVYKVQSLGRNFVGDASCRLFDPTDVARGDPQLRPLEDDPNGFVLTPFDSSPVRARIPGRECALTLPTGLPARRLLDPYLDWRQVLVRDAVGTRRDTGASCDIGAVESPKPPAEPPASPPPPPTTPAGLTIGRAMRPLVAGTRAAAATRAGGPGGQPLAALDRRITRLEAASRRFDVLRSCITELGVDQVGDPAHRWGYRYAERDGTGIDLRPALARHGGAGRPDLRFLRLSRAPRCLSAAPDPLGTGRAAGTGGRPTPDGDGLQRRVDRIERRVHRFDAWESCLSWLPVTEAGDPAQDLGYLRRAGRRHDAAIDLDTSEWDDPDYQLLAFVGTDRPFGRAACDTEPGEGFTGLGADRTAGPIVTTARTRGPAAGIGDLEEDLDDLEEPVGDITRFDECLYTVGAKSRGRYAYRGRGGRRGSRTALSFDLGRGLPQLDLLAFPGEEPPQIECNEDAGGEDTEE
jgi:hypothetical protein